MTPAETGFVTALGCEAMSDGNPDVKIPVDEEGAAEIASEGEDEDGVTEEQRDALAEIQARLIGDID